MNDLTIRELICLFLLSRLDESNDQSVAVTTNTIQLKACQWAAEHYNRTHAPSTWSRRWRELREDFRASGENSELARLAGVEEMIVADDSPKTHLLRQEVGFSAPERLTAPSNQMSRAA